MTKPQKNSLYNAQVAHYHKVNQMFLLDNFIKDDELVSAIKSDKDFFPDTSDVDNIGQYNNHFHSGMSSCHAPYMFWDGWWSSPANTLRKKVIEKIWKHNDTLPFPIEDVCGFEYWCRTFKEGQYLDVHVDEDTFAYSKDKTFNAPAYGAIWYGFTECHEGGFLEIHKNRIEGFPKNILEKENFNNFISSANEKERIAYVPNRLITFDAGRRVHETTKIVSGTRQVMVINIWHKDCPPSALGTGEFYYE